MKSDIMQRDFFSQVSIQHHFKGLLDGVTGVAIFFKDCEGRIIYGNANLLVSLGYENEAELVGKKDTDIFPPHLVDKYKKDDLAVIKNKEAKLNIIELFFNKQGLLKWFVTHKYPVFNFDGQVIGVMGSIQEYGRMNDPLPGDNKDILAVSEYIKEHFRQSIPIETLSKLANIPVRQFQRKFKAYFNISPREYIIRHRIYCACEALRGSDMDISDISDEVGFYDQSSFTSQFKKYTGLTPLKYRKAGR